MANECGSCRFWNWIEEVTEHEKEGAVIVDDDKQSTVGQCRRFPPVIALIELGESVPHSPTYTVWDATKFPITDGTDWCGEWQPAAGIP